MTAIPMPRYEATSTDALRSLKMGVPCILTNTNLVSSAVTNWSLSYLNTHIPETTEWTIYKSSSTFLYADEPNDGAWDFRSKVTKQHMRFHSFVSELERACSNDDGHIPFFNTTPTPTSSSAPSPTSTEHPQPNFITQLPPETGKIRPLIHMLAHTQDQINNYPPEAREPLKQALYDSLSNTHMIHASINSETTNFSLHAIKSPTGESSSSTNSTASSSNSSTTSSPKEIPKFLSSLNFSTSRLPSELIYLQQNLHVYIGNRLLQDCKNFNYNYLHSVHRFAEWGDLCGNMLYIGQKGCINPCHYDDMNNLYCQLKGKKLVLLSSPRYFPSLYPAPVGHPTDRQSLVNIRCPNLQNYPKFTEAQFIYAVLEPGEVLFIPSCWYHYMESPYEDTISLNFWFFHTPPPPTPTSPLPLRDSATRTALRRNIEKFAGQAIGSYELSSQLFAKLGENIHRQDLSTIEQNLYIQIRNLLVQVLEPKDVERFLIDMCTNRFNLPHLPPNDPLRKQISMTFNETASAIQFALKKQQQLTNTPASPTANTPNTTTPSTTAAVANKKEK